jgi:hypothetical protein
VATVQAAEQPKAAKIQLPGTFEVKVSQGYLSLEANEAPLAQLFQEIGKQARINFDSNIGPEKKVTIHLERVPLEHGKQRLWGYGSTLVLVALRDLQKTPSRQDLGLVSRQSKPDSRIVANFPDYAS